MQKLLKDIPTTAVYYSYKNRNFILEAVTLEDFKERWLMSIADGKDTDGWAKVITNIEKQPTYEAIRRYFLNHIHWGESHYGTVYE